NNGTLTGGVAFAAGKVGQAFSFDGTGEVTIANSAALNPATMTFDAWVYPTALDGEVECILTKEQESTFPYQFTFGIRGAGNPGVGSIPIGHFAFFFGGVSGLPQDYSFWVDGGGAVPLNEWSHIAATYDGASAKTYVNGVLARTVTGLSGNVA